LRINTSVLDKRAAEELVRQLKLDAIPVCPMCLFDLAWQIHQGKPRHPATVARTADWVWPELEEGLREAVVEARMREVAGAEDALGDLESRGWRSPLVRAVVERLAQQMADEFGKGLPRSV
jgi:phosphoglycolate phosphatase-like HAD superfamily hydrolase